MNRLQLQGGIRTEVRGLTGMMVVDGEPKAALAAVYRKSF